jgi:hypothetical protein
MPSNRPTRPGHSLLCRWSRRQAAEDVGGVGGYQNCRTIIADPRDPERADTKRWRGGHFNPPSFDLEMTGNDFRNALRPNARRRLHQSKPKRAKSYALTGDF